MVDTLQGRSDPVVLISRATPVYEGGLAGLTSDEWLSRWRTFRKRHAQLEKAVEVLKGEIKRNGHWLMPPGGRRT